MAQVTLDLGSPEQTQRIIDALCEAHGYTGPSSGKAAAAKSYLITWVREIVHGVERAKLQTVPVEPPAVTLT